MALGTLKMDGLFSVSVLLTLVIFRTEGRKCTKPCDCGDSAFDGWSSQEIVYTMNCSDRELFYAPHVHGDVKVLDLSGNLFEDYPAALMASNIQALLLGNNNITVIPDKPISNSELTYLDMTGNDVHLNDSGFYPGFGNLETLKIESSVLFDDSFSGLKQLTELHLVVRNESVPAKLLATTDIADNLRKLIIRTETIPPLFFQSLKKIEEIQLYIGDGITELSHSTFDIAGKKTMNNILINAKNLKISDRQLLMNLDELSEITLELDVETMPSDVLYTVKSGLSCDKSPDTCKQEQNRLYLQKVTIKGVKQLPIELLEYVPFLEYLEITGTEIPPEYLLSKTGMLETLKLRHDNISAISLRLLPIPMKGLTHLNLSYNVIAEINADNFKQTPMLEILDLSHNAISTIHKDAFHNLRNLLYLNLSHNNICQLPSTVFRDLTSLYSLYHQFNCIARLEPNLFHDLISLTFLNLQVNNITQIPEGLFSNMEKLELLNLNDNKIVGLSRDTLNYFYNSSLRRVDLSDNDLRNFPVFQPPENTNLEYFIIGNNANLECGCGMVPLIKLINTEGFCAKPKEFKGTKISDLKPKEICPETTQTPTTERPTTETLAKRIRTTDSITTVYQDDNIPFVVSIGDHPHTDIPDTDSVSGPLMSISDYDNSYTNMADAHSFTSEIPKVLDEFTGDPDEELSQHSTKIISESGTTSAAHVDIQPVTCIEPVTMKVVDGGKDISTIPTESIGNPNNTDGVWLNVGDRNRASGSTDNDDRSIHISDLFPWWVIVIAVIGGLFLIGVVFAVIKQRGKLYERSYTVNHV